MDQYIVGSVAVISLFAGKTRTQTKLKIKRILPPFPNDEILETNITLSTILLQVIYLRGILKRNF